MVMGIVIFGIFGIFIAYYIEPVAHRDGICLGRDGSFEAPR